jgi:hypothetical protein
MAVDGKRNHRPVNHLPFSVSGETPQFPESATPGMRY